MNEMVERVAKAIYDAWPQKSGREFSELQPFEVAFAATQARAAIAAMREPTEAMVEVGLDAADCAQVEPSWYAMIDAALAEP